MRATVRFRVFPVHHHVVGSRSRPLYPRAPPCVEWETRLGTNQATKIPSSSCCLHRIPGSRSECAFIRPPSTDVAPRSCTLTEHIRSRVLKQEHAMFSSLSLRCGTCCGQSTGCHRKSFRTSPDVSYKRTMPRTRGRSFH